MAGVEKLMTHQKPVMAHLFVVMFWGTKDLEAITYPHSFEFCWEWPYFFYWTDKVVKFIVADKGIVHEKNPNNRRDEESLEIRS